MTSQHLDMFVLLLLRSQPGSVAVWSGPNGEVAWLNTKGAFSSSELLYELWLVLEASPSSIVELMLRCETDSSANVSRRCRPSMDQNNTTELTVRTHEPLAWSIIFLWWQSGWLGLVGKHGFCRSRYTVKVRGPTCSNQHGRDDLTLVQGVEGILSELGLGEVETPAFWLVWWTPV